MKGMDTVISVRREGMKPSCVLVYLVDAIDHEGASISEKGTVIVEIAKHESLSDIDFRPLVGLYVLLCDVVDDMARYRQLGALVAAVNPSRLVMPIDDGETYTVHRREGGKTESFRL
jgi:hypothetical protein